MILQESGENYLETILMLQQQTAVSVLSTLQRI